MDVSVLRPDAARGREPERAGELVREDHGVGVRDRLPLDRVEADDPATRELRSSGLDVEDVAADVAAGDLEAERVAGPELVVGGLVSARARLPAGRPEGDRVALRVDLADDRVAVRGDPDAVGAFDQALRGRELADDRPLVCGDPREAADLRARDVDRVSDLELDRHRPGGRDGGKCPDEGQPERNSQSHHAEVLLARYRLRRFWIATTAINGCVGVPKPGTDEFRACVKAALQAANTKPAAATP